MTEPIRFDPVWCASGTLNFFGEGWPYHERLKRWIPRRFDWRGAAFASKTTTLESREGNMPLEEDLQPTERVPRCIWMSHRRGIALNAVGLSGPGARALFEDGGWQAIQSPFQISFMALGNSKQERICELKQFLALLDEYLPWFTAPIVLQINFSCPNVEHDAGELGGLIVEIREVLDRVAEHQLQAIPKLNVLFPPARAREISDHPACYGICISNTTPFGATVPWLPAESALQVPWKRLFGRKMRSPLRRRGIEADGGLSGKPLLPIVCTWVKLTRQHGVTTHLNACGGVLSPRDVDRCSAAGADSVSLGSIAFLRPWRVRPTIERAYWVFS